MKTIHTSSPGKSAVVLRDWDQLGSTGIDWDGLGWARTDWDRLGSAGIGLNDT